MWRVLWRSIDRFSVQHFKSVINELRQIKDVDEFNKDFVIDLLQSVVEIVTYGDRHDPAIFECFMEYQVLGEFVRILKNSKHVRIEAPLLQYVSIMIQNMDSEHAIYYCLSNDYVNTIITHPYQFDIGDLAPYYVSFLRSVSSKLNRDTLCLLVKVQEDAVVSFKLYSEAIRFAHHGEKMIQTAVRALTLNVYNVSDDMVFQFITTPPVSVYFSDLVLSIKKQLVNLDKHVQSTEGSCPHKKTRERLTSTDKIIDDLYYLDDVIRVGDSRLNKLVVSNLVSLIVLPMLIPVLQFRQIDVSFLSGVTSLAVISQLLQIVQEENLVNFVASAVLFSDMSFAKKDATEGVTNDGANYDMAFQESTPAEHLKRNFLLAHLSGYLSSESLFARSDCNVMMEGRTGIMLHILTDNMRLVLASLMLLVVVAESKGLDGHLADLMGFLQRQTNMQMRFNSSDSGVLDDRSFARHLPQILHLLLMFLASQPPYSVSTQWQMGWFLRKLLVFQGNKLDRDDVNIFNVSYERSSEHLSSELGSCWFDHIPDTLTNEWESCKRVLEESSQLKDPFFVFELSRHQHASCSDTNCDKIFNGGNNSEMEWERMVNAVKVFVLHIHLKTFFFHSDPFENHMLNLKRDSLAVSARNNVSDFCSASFGSEVSLASAIPCKIAFSKAGTRDIYIAPTATGISGKLLLLEKHPLHSKRGLVIAIAPLAGVKPTIDENHSAWLHLQIRELEPRFGERKMKSDKLSTPYHEQDGRWTLGFADAKACDDARMVIIDETNKQRSCVENLIAPLLDNRPSVLTELGELQEDINMRHHANNLALCY